MIYNTSTLHRSSCCQLRKKKGRHTQTCSPVQSGQVIKSQWLQRVVFRIWTILRQEDIIFVHSYTIANLMASLQLWSKWIKIGALLNISLFVFLGNRYAVRTLLL
jgi:hypothetical protein